MKKIPIDPKNLSFNKESMHGYSPALSFTYIFASIRSWLSCKMFFSSLKSHRNDDEWLQKEYDKLCDEYEEFKKAKLGPILDTVGALKWKMEACHLMMKTPKSQRDKIDFAFERDMKYSKMENGAFGIKVNSDRNAQLEGYEFKIVNKSTIKK